MTDVTMRDFSDEEFSKPVLHSETPAPVEPPAPIEPVEPGEAALEPVEISTDLEPIVKGIIAEINKGSIKLADVLKRLARKPTPYARPEKTPVPAVLTAEEKEALERFHSVFGQVTPTERVMLPDSDLRALMDERLVLDVIDKMVAKRKDAIRTAVFNHFDTVAEKDYPVDEDGALTGAEYDKDGFFIREDEHLVPEHDARFVRQVSEGGANVTTAKLEKLLADGEIERKDYLAMTEQVRVVNEQKVLLHMRRNPKIVTVLGLATELGRRTISFYAKPMKKKG